MSNSTETNERQSAGKPLAGRTAWVSGGAGGIGAAAARLLVSDGAAVLLLGRGEAALQKTRTDLLRDFPQGRVEIYAGDAGKESDVQAALRQAHGMQNRLDIIVATVGGGFFRPMMQQDVATFRGELELNIVTAFMAVLFGVPLMTAGGSIVCTSSTAAVMPYGKLAAYCAAKGGLEMFVRSAAEELGAAKIRVNAVRPGLTRATTNTEMFANKKLVDRFLVEIPLARVGEPVDIAGAIRYLAGPESSWVTGQCFAVDGGAELRKIPDLTGV